MVAKYIMYSIIGAVLNGMLVIAVLVAYHFINKHQQKRIKEKKGLPVDGQII